MKVCVALSGLGLVERGIEVLVKEVSKRIAGNVDLTVLSGGFHQSPSYTCKRLPVISRKHFKNIIRTTRKLGLDVSDLALESLSFLPGCTYEWLNNNYDLIVNFHRYTVECSSILKAARVLKSKLVYCDQGGSPLLRGSHRHDCVIVTAPCYKEAYDSSKYKVFAIPNGVDIQKFNPQNDGSAIRDRYGLSEDDFVIFSVGEFIHWKGFDLVIKAVGKIPDAHLILCGDGQLKNQLKTLASKVAEGRVTFAGSIPHEKMPSYYAACDVFALGSYEEAFGIVLLEAMASGKPVVANNAPAQKWIVGKAGLTLNVKDVKDFSRGILSLRNKSSSEKASALARKRVERHFSWDNVSQRYLQVFKNLYYR